MPSCDGKVSQISSAVYIEKKKKVMSTAQINLSNLRFLHSALRNIIDGLSFLSFDKISRPFLTPILFRT
jgi:hypothetical protein